MFCTIGCHATKIEESLHAHFHGSDGIPHHHRGASAQTRTKARGRAPHGRPTHLLASFGARSPPLYRWRQVSDSQRVPSGARRRGRRVTECWRHFSHGRTGRSRRRKQDGERWTGCTRMMASPGQPRRQKRENVMIVPSPFLVHLGPYFLVHRQIKRYPWSGRRERCAHV